MERAKTALKCTAGSCSACGFPGYRGAPARSSTLLPGEGLGARCPPRSWLAPDPLGRIITRRLDKVGSVETLPLPRKEVIQPQLPLRLPCYDFVPITSPTLDGCLPEGLAHRLQALPAFVT